MQNTPCALCTSDQYFIIILDAVATRDKQLKELQEIIDNYCKEKRLGVNILFSILCGHLGFDNISSGGNLIN